MARKPFRRNIARVHITTLAHEHGIAIRWLSGRRWMKDSQAYHAAWAVSIPRPYSPQQYLVGLHELGHLLGAVTTGHQHAIPVGPSNVIEEVSAWYWALTNVPASLDQSIEWEMTRKLLGVTLSTHLWHAALSAGGQALPD